MNNETRYTVIVEAVLIVNIFISVYLLFNHPKASRGDSQNVMFSSNGNTTRTNSLTAVYNLAVNPINPMSMDEYDIPIYVNSTETSAMDGSYKISRASNTGVQTKSSSPSVVSVSNNTVPGYMVFFANFGTETVSSDSFLGVSYLQIMLSEGTVSMIPVTAYTRSGVTINLSYSGYSEMAGVTL